MAIDVEFRSVTTASREVAWDYVSDYHNTPQWLYGLQKFEPLTEQTSGVDAVYDASVNVGATLHSRVKVIEWEEGHKIRFKSVKGFDADATFTFTPTDDGGMEVLLQVAYNLPGGLPGKALGRVIAPFVKIAIKHSSEHLAANMTAHGAKAG